MRAHTRTLPIKGSKNLSEHLVEVKTEDDEGPSLPWREVLKDVIDEFTEIGATLRGFRLREELTQKQMASLLGVSQGDISKMEYGKRPISKKMAKRLAELFDTNYRLFL